MKLAKPIAILTVAATVMAVPGAFAANVIKANNNTSLDQGGSWSGGAGPAPGTGDVATWDSTVATAANCTNTLSANTNWGGIEILNPSAPVQITGGSTLFIGSSGIDLNEAGTSQSLFLNLPVNIFADQNWNIASGQTLTFATTGIITTNNTVTVNGNVNCNNGFSISGGGTLAVAGGTFSLVTNFSSTKPFSVGTDGNGGTVTQSGGTVQVSAAAGTSGSYVVSLPIGAAGNAVATYNLNGGTLSDITSNTFAFCSPGNSSGSVGTLNINGGAAAFYSLRLGNSGGHGFVNVTNGSLTVKQGEFSIGRGSTGAAGTSDDGTFSVYGGTVSAPGISVNLPHGNGPGILNMNGGSFNVGNSLSIPQASTGNGTLNMYGGVLNVTNNLNLPGGGTGTGTVNLNGGVLAVSSVAVSSGGASSLELNGGTLKARANSGNFIANNNLLTVHVDSGGAVIDTTNFGVTIAAVLQSNASPDGGLTKLGGGTLTLSAVNTYNGPTVAGGGTLVLSTTNNNTIGALIVSNAAALNTAIATAGTTLNCSSFTDGTSSSGSATNQFTLGAFGNPSSPVINASSLTVNGTVNVIVNGSGFTIGTIQLIKYSGTVSGSGSFALKLLAGAAGYVTNDTTAKSINVVITGFPQLTWRAQVNTNWDLATANWVDTNNLQTTYVDGATTFFDDTASNTLVNVVGGFSPASVNLSNVNSNYIFGGSGSIGGTASLTKTGAGTVMMALTNNSYSGNTVINNGVFQLGVRNAIPNGTGNGNVTLEGKLDLAGFNQALNGLNGSKGVVDNSGAGPVVLSVGNGNASGVFSGLITNSGASLSLNVTGGGITLQGTNTYSGSTTNSGTLVLAVPQSIGSGPLVLNGGTLSWLDSQPHTLSNSVTIGGSVTFGTAANGMLTFSQIADLGGAGRAITCNNNVAFTNGITDGTISTKSGSGTLLVQNTTADWTSGSMQVSQGALVFGSGTGVIEDGGNVRLQCTITNGLARLVVTNGGAMVFSNDVSQNLKVGANDTSGGPGCTNILDVAGTLSLIPYPTTAGGTLYLGGSSGNRDAADIVNLLAGGILRVRQITNSGVVPTLRVFNFNGGTLVASTNDAAGDFLDGNIFANGVSGFTVLDGGAIIDTAGYNGITVNNDLVAGGTGVGGLTKNGGGQLILAGSIFGNPSDYGGPTVVNAGTLTIDVSVPNTTNFMVAPGAVLDVSSTGEELTSGRYIGGGGSVLGSITVDSGASVQPGTQATIGTLTFSTAAPTLNGTVLIKLDKTGVIPASDQVTLSSGTLNYGGTLVVTNIGATPASGDRFVLFNPAGGFSGSFASMTLPTLPAGLGWTNNLAVDGSLTVTGAVVTPSIPRFNSVVLKNGSLVMSGTNGSATTSYRVLAATNITLPMSSWTPVATNSFDGSGNFIFTNTINPASPMLFYRLISP